MLSLNGIVFKILCLEQILKTSITKAITMKTKITLAAALVMTAFSFFSTAPAEAAAFVKLGDIAAEMLWMELLENDHDRSSSYSEVECVYVTLRGLGFDDDEAIVGLVLMSEDSHWMRRFGVWQQNTASLIQISQ